MFRNILRKILPLLILLTAASALGAASISGGIPVREGLFYSEEELAAADQQPDEEEAAGLHVPPGAYRPVEARLLP